MAREAGDDAVLEVLDGPMRGARFPLRQDEMLLGRADAGRGIFPDIDLTAADPEGGRGVSRRHALLLRGSGGHAMEALSRNALTAVNGEALALGHDGRRRLTPGDELLLGTVRLRYAAARPAATPRSPAVAVLMLLCLAGLGAMLAWPEPPRWDARLALAEPAPAEQLRNLDDLLRIPR
ncbi:FHA domain-containing protein [Falsiroseomonas ponticola]|uniref:FHA domain-containing protein n=1 Tax=Falsiroseomonas ponticola TaxID=2786951 RepID=UPI001931DAD5|nr:FHA domain-containing protein [Roseomonas ponticola]